jgi:transposase
MGQNFLACDRDQELLLPPSLREWLPENHLAWFVIDAVAALDLSAFYASYRDDGWGRAAHDPQMMVALMLYAYARGERSARLIERRCTEDVAYRVIAANQRPDHATIARFRARHEGALSGLFGQVLGLCANAGLVAVGVVALDGTKLHAAASGQANMSYDQIAKEILEDAARIDAEEDALYGDRRGDELPPELADPATRKARLAEAKRRLEAEWEGERKAAEAHNARCEEHAQARAAGAPRMGRPPRPRPLPEQPSGRVNVTDPDSRPVKTHRGFLQGYNAQAVATEDQILIAADIVIGGTDQGLLAPMAAQAVAELKAAGVAQRPQTLLADAGYWSSKQIGELRRSGIDAFVSPDGQARRGPPASNRRAQLAPARRPRLNDDEGRALYRKRQQIIEPVFGQTKANRGIDRFLRRGVTACRSEWRLITATHNLLKLWRHGLAVA